MANAKAQVKIKALQIVSARAGFRRAGIVFGKEPVTVALSILTPEQIKQLKSEPMLAVSEVEIDAGSEDAASAE